MLPTAASSNGVLVTPQPVLVAGYCDSSRDAMTAMSDWAAARVTVGFKRPIALSEWPPRDPNSPSLNTRGAKIAISRPPNRQFGCMMPTISNDWPFRTIASDTTSRPPNSRCQKAWPRMTTMF